jgi:hypothetical protein
MGIALVLAVLTAVAGGLSVLNAQDASTGIHVGTVSPIATMITRFVVVLVFGTFGLFFARQSHLKGSLFISSESFTFTVRDVAIYGILPGLVLGLINYFFFFTYRYSPMVAPRIRDIDTIYDSFVVSLASGSVEEVVYRLFYLSCFLFFFQHIYARLAPLWPSVVSLLPKALAVVISALLFAMVHNIYGFTAAFFGGILLGVIYLQSGIESAIAAHVCANFLFFSASYLS